MDTVVKIFSSENSVIPYIFVEIYKELRKSEYLKCDKYSYVHVWCITRGRDLLKLSGQFYFSNI